jgi:cytochrome c-type biogenesis protein CcmH/NrfF
MSARHGIALRVMRILLFAGLIAALAAPALAEKKSPMRQITDDIICPCSCGEVLTGCTCETAVEMRAFVEKSLKAGQSKGEVTHALVAQYGEVVLGAPRAKGFNLVVWIAPFLATLLGFGIAFFLLRRWAGRRPAAATTGRPGSTGSAEQDLDALRARAEEELRRLRG